MNSIIRLLGAILCFCAGSLHANAAESKTASKAYSQLSSLVGDWQEKGKSNPALTIRFELTAGGSTVMETWIYDNKPHSLTVYHRDGNDLLATHYCPQGNQPRLKLTSFSSRDGLVFDFKDATNLASLDSSHQHGLSFKWMENGKTLVRGETYLSKEGPDVSGLTLARVGH